MRPGGCPCSSAELRPISNHHTAFSACAHSIKRAFASTNAFL